jgi:hypothetical protein
MVGNWEQCMIGRSIKVRQVFVELRRSLGAEIPAGELLTLSAKLVDAARPIQSRDEHRRICDRPAFDQAPLDRAFSDGGWRIMHRERNWVADAYKDDDPGFAATNGGIGEAVLAA